jgi:hypothetical protein
MEMHDMGEMRNMGGEISAAEGNPKKEKYYPSTYLSSKKLPGIEKYDVGDKCILHSEAKIVGKREKDDGEVEIEIETIKCGIMKGKSKDEYMSMSDEAKDKEDKKEILSEEE